jgi:hypothetical protein
MQVLASTSSFQSTKVKEKIWVRPFIDICYADQGINCIFSLMQVSTLASAICITKVMDKKGVAFQRHLLCRSRNQLQIFIDASVDIEILILRYKGEGEEGCDMSSTFVMQIEQWGSASWSVILFLEVGCGDSSHSFSLYFWKTKSAFCGEV